LSAGQGGDVEYFEFPPYSRECAFAGSITPASKFNVVRMMPSITHHTVIANQPQPNEIRETRA